MCVETRVLQWFAQNYAAHCFSAFVHLLNLPQHAFVWNYCLNHSVCCSAALSPLCSLWMRSYCDRFPHIEKTQLCLRRANKRGGKKKIRAGVGARRGRDTKRRWRAKTRAVLSKAAAPHHKNNKWRLSLLLWSQSEGRNIFHVAGPLTFKWVVLSQVWFWQSTRLFLSLLPMRAATILAFMT